jgi:hypothetical protein
MYNQPLTDFGKILLIYVDLQVHSDHMFIFESQWYASMLIATQCVQEYNIVSLTPHGSQVSHSMNHWCSAWRIGNTKHNSQFDDGDTVIRCRTICGRIQRCDYGWRRRRFDDRWCCEEMTGETGHTGLVTVLLAFVVSIQNRAGHQG